MFIRAKAEQALQNAVPTTAQFNVKSWRAQYCIRPESLPIREQGQTNNRDVSQLRHLIRMLLINQHIPIPWQPLFEINTDLVRLLHRPINIPAPHTLVREELQHILDFLRTPSRAASELNALAYERERAETRKRFFRRADLDEYAVEPQEAEVFLKRHLRGRDGADEDVDAVTVFAGPFGIFVCGDEVCCAHG